MSTKSGQDGFDRASVENSAVSDQSTERFLADARDTESLNNYRNKLDTASNSPSPNQLGFGAVSIMDNGKACAT